MCGRGRVKPLPTGGKSSAFLPATARDQRDTADAVPRFVQTQAIPLPFSYQSCEATEFGVKLTSVENVCVEQWGMTSLTEVQCVGTTGHPRASQGAPISPGKL